eukprot:TRINITY_DN10204_c0_g1_i2.p1 TRINITY_DN10204_c0_g1~~TRINITY_DN10204_c0_g1_i2.p1  ORF type:complete len:223 (+),score=60.61 TRINITY_DN10204_c0_g1_i2:77-745(+)
MSHGGAEREALTTMDPILPSAWVCRGVLTAAECAMMREHAEQLGMDDLGEQYGRKLRDCLRSTFVDPELAARVWRRLQPLVPGEVRVGPGQATPAGVKCSPELHGTWRPCGVREEWVVVCYPGDGQGHFGPHRDGDQVFGDHRRSMLTVNGYLSALPPGSGGATRFLEDDQPVRHDAAGRCCPREGSVLAAVQPDEEGKAVVFFHGAPSWGPLPDLLRALAG